MSVGGAVLRAARVRFKPRAAAVFGAGYTEVELIKMNTKERIMSIRLMNQIKNQPEYSKQIGLSYPEISKREETRKNEKNKK